MEARVPIDGGADPLLPDEPEIGGGRAIASAFFSMNTLRPRHLTFVHLCSCAAHVIRWVTQTGGGPAQNLLYNWSCVGNCDLRRSIMLSRRGGTLLALWG